MFGADALPGQMSVQSVPAGNSVNWQNMHFPCKTCSANCFSVIPAYNNFIECIRASAHITPESRNVFIGRTCCTLVMFSGPGRCSAVSSELQTRAPCPWARSFPGALQSRAALAPRQGRLWVPLGQSAAFPGAAGRGRHPAGFGAPRAVGERRSRERERDRSHRSEGAVCDRTAAPPLRQRVFAERKGYRQRTAPTVLSFQFRWLLPVSLPLDCLQ